MGAGVDWETRELGSGRYRHRWGLGAMGPGHDQEGNDAKNQIGGNIEVGEVLW
jgi:hypothetical protein